MSKVRTGDEGYVTFKCPGCGDRHTIRLITEERPEGWTWNGDLELPTFNPSVLVRCGHYSPRWNKDSDDCWCGKDYGFSCYLCHSWVEDGYIRFLPDSSHELAGKRVPLPDFD